MNDEDLYEKLSERILTKGSAFIPELFRMIADEEEARIMLATPGTAEELADKLGYPLEEMEQKLDLLYHKGLVFKADKPQGTLYRMCRDITQFHDATILWDGTTPEYLALWGRQTQEELPDYINMVSMVIPKPFTRVVPVNQPVEARQSILAFEDVEQMVHDAGKLAVVNCTCRLVDGKCGKPLEVCLQLGKAADYTIDRGSGREVSEDEAMEIIRMSEEAGLIHVAMNKAYGSHIICNCCEDCCVAFGLPIEATKIVDPSRFLAVVDADTCSGCGDCVERCFFDAVTLEERDGEEISVIAAEKCMGCGLCQVTCPEDAISMQAVREEDFVPNY
ncbi:MAG: 4Fe-4S dicluster domain-containing protein [Actinobacteria bacterium]|jgi:ferredoxin|nr:MAG: 4Fe-4S dicluster domain-containing protein [Actinomycetota bacterium]